MRSEQDISRAIDTYGDMIRRICLVHLKNHADSEDVFQNVFLKYLLHPGEFADAGHENAWVIRVTLNACKDHLRGLRRHPTTSLEVIAEEAAVLDEDKQAVLEAVLALPPKYKDALYLHYYEGYTAAEIGAILHKKENTVYSLLSRGRSALAQTLGGEANG